MPRIETYLKIARNTEVFRAEELKVLEEVLEDFRTNPETNYVIFEEIRDGIVLGFVMFGRTPLTEFCWDVYWLIVDKHIQGKGIGKKLLIDVENFILQSMNKAILRAETSTKKEYTHARNLYTKQGFKECGRIPAFYGKWDDLIIFYKEIAKHEETKNQ